MKSYTISEAQLEFLADDLLNTFCPEGMRNTGGRYTKFPFEDQPTALRRTVLWLKRALEEASERK